MPPALRAFTERTSSKHRNKSRSDGWREVCSSHRHSKGARSMFPESVRCHDAARRQRLPAPEQRRQRGSRRKREGPLPVQHREPVGRIAGAALGLRDRRGHRLIGRLIGRLSRSPYRSTDRSSRHTVAMTMNPRELLDRGVVELAEVLGPAGFTFVALDEDDGSGDASASGEFRRGDCRLELRVRRSLGLVRYHFGDQTLSHEDFVRGVRALDGISAEAEYPGFSDDPRRGISAPPRRSRSVR